MVRLWMEGWKGGAERHGVVPRCVAQGYPAGVGNLGASSRPELDE